jgi:hypothetical protein
MELNRRFLYRMTHIENVPHVLKHGLTHRDSPNQNPNFVPIGDGQLISKRATYLLPNQTRLGDYIPFYFGPRMPMLYVIQRGFSGVPAVSPEKIVYCISSVADIMACQSVSFLFTDGHAYDGFSTCFGADRVDELNQLIDWKAVNNKYWQDENDLDLKRRKEAEFLLLGDLPVSAIRGYVVYADIAAKRLVEMGVSADKVVTRPDYYF